MAKNKGGRRIGAIRGRTQFMLPNGHYAKRDRLTGEILSVKADLTPYKNVVIERDPQPAPSDRPRGIASADTRAIASPLRRQARRARTQRPHVTPAAKHQPRSGLYPHIR